MDIKRIKSITESLMFINEKPIEANVLREVLEVDKKELETALEELTRNYKDSKMGICIVKVAGGYQMCSAPENEPWIKRMYQEKNKHKLSIASLETLAIAAYKQPITRIEIEAIRGVNVDGVVKKLSDLGLIKIVGRKDVIGKPFLYATTRKFLEYFGINSLKDLPKLEDFIALAEKENIQAAENNDESDQYNNTVQKQKVDMEVKDSKNQENIEEQSKETINEKNIDDIDDIKEEERIENSIEERNKNEENKATKEEIIQ